jgi:hypothetical protein
MGGKGIAKGAEAPGASDMGGDEMSSARNGLRTPAALSWAKGTLAENHSSLTFPT